MMTMQRRTRARVILHKNIPGWLRHIAETENVGYPLPVINENKVKTIGARERDELRSVREYLKKISSPRVSCIVPFSFDFHRRLNFIAKDPTS